MTSLLFRGFYLTVAVVLSLIIALVSGFTITEVCAFSAFIIAVDTWFQLQISNIVITAMFNHLKNQGSKDARKAE